MKKIKKKYKVRLIDTWKELKKEYVDTIILMQYGNFIRVFDNDTYILNYVTGYKIYDNRIGFPISEIERIKLIFNDLKINYYFYNGCCAFYEENTYFFILDMGKRNCYKNELLDLLKGCHDIKEIEKLCDKEKLKFLKDKYE